MLPVSEHFLSRAAQAAQRLKQWLADLSTPQEEAEPAEAGDAAGAAAPLAREAYAALSPTEIRKLKVSGRARGCGGEAGGEEGARIGAGSAVHGEQRG